ncbi:MAG: pyridoxamine 5'-phosphate oxidase family protein [Bacilli bacterium]|jgi:uncharacterized pyridoxamine 5'-phosphate oxidase family protein|nr:pyridoxamine 5'-phosphate oxidase family protein [Bacilli bacterium]
MDTNRKVYEYLLENVFFVATSDKEPHVRPFGAVIFYNDKVCICTSNKKNVCNQIKANPVIEIAAVDQVGKWLRVKATASLKDNNIEARDMFFEQYPNVKQLYNGRENEFTVFSLNIKAAILDNMDGTTTSL